MLPDDKPIRVLPGEGTRKPDAWSSQATLTFVLLFGAANLFADMSYEGARSVTGPFLGTLGASGLIVGTVAGFGELLGYTLRFISGRWADRSRLYWPITLLGYSVQMVAVPALALAGNWPLAAALIVLERVGRATRTPPRDVMLAQAGEDMGRGWAFGLNEALDQLGAMIGPLIVAAALAWRHDFQVAFALLAVPAVVTLSVVFAARFIYPNAGRAVRPSPTGDDGGYPLGFWWYVIAASLVGFGFADFSLLAYHFSRAQTVASTWIPVFYALAMGAGGLGSLILGRLFDRIGLIVLVPSTIVAAAYAPLCFSGGFGAALLGSVLWGAGLGAHESVMQAAVAEMIPPQRLGAAYGLFAGFFGVSWFVGSAAMGALYDFSVPAAMWLAVVAQLLAIVPLLIASRRLAQIKGTQPRTRV
jgi:MFS family permease